MTDMPVNAAGLAGRPSFDARQLLGRYGAIFVLVLMIVTFSIIEPTAFPTKDNAINILNQCALAAIIAMGLTFPLLAGEFDLSIGYNASLCGVVACELMLKQNFSIPLAFLVAIALGATVGLVNGLLITRIRVNALVATLGVGTVVVGINYAISGGLPVSVNNTEQFINLSLGKLFGIPYPVYVMVVVAALLWVLLNRTILGQSMQAVGGNPVAARLSGIRVDRTRTLVFVLAGACAAVTGVLLASRTGSASVDGGDGYMLSAFAAAFFGSAVLRDGQFHIVGTLLGVLTVAVGFNAIAITGINTYYQYLFQGGLLIFAVGVGTLARRQAG
ncbi:MAG: transporter permease [Conexibacter sp.]|jgi:ribose transport system permease protein|nr:transporter permease [Conexibacter sp.]MCZ4493980.1 transporter permease [Conexibacter sp.]MDX6714490.1 ribose transport system permease protein [Baekduia sp.]MDX6730653.1 ribose transport system permease protein [Baekduia sp.]